MGQDRRGVTNVWSIESHYAPPPKCHAFPPAPTAMDNSDITDEGLGRLSLVPRLDGRRFRLPSTIACDPKTRGDCPRFRTDIAVGNVRFPAAPFSSTTSKLPFPRPPTPLRLDDIVWPSPASWQVRSAQRHFDTTTMGW
jgi:hypothetical protein